MRETYRVLPVYAGDVSGIAGALYELGGMTVIHDPSGCNSTYNTHDELRWYKEPSAIFISGLNMRDAVLGNDKKFIDDTLEAAASLPQKPAFIALCNSPLPWLNGTDFHALSRIIENKSGIPTFYVSSNGCRDYAEGAGRAFLSLLEKFDGELREKAAGHQSVRAAGKKDCNITVNVIGMMPLDFAHPESLRSLKERMAKNGFAIQSVFARTDGTSEDLLADILSSSAADVSLVLSTSGIPAAQYLKAHYGVPFVVGVPLEEDDPVFEQLRRAAAGLNYEACLYTVGKDNMLTIHSQGASDCAHTADNKNRPENGQADTASQCIAVLSEPVLAGSLASLLERRTGRKVLVINPLEGRVWNGHETRAHSSRRLASEKKAALADPLPEDRTRQAAGRSAGTFYDSIQILRPGDLSLFGEEEMERGIAAAGVREIYCDPMYAEIFSEGITLRPMPTLALSGRVYRNTFINYFDTASVEELISREHE